MCCKVFCGHAENQQASGRVARPRPARAGEPEAKAGLGQEEGGRTGAGGGWEAEWGGDGGRSGPTGCRFCGSSACWFLILFSGLIRLHHQLRLAPVIELVQVWVWLIAAAGVYSGTNRQMSFYSEDTSSSQKSPMGCSIACITATHRFSISSHFSQSHDP